MPKPRPSTHFVTAHSVAQHWPRRTDTPSLFTAFVRGLQGERTPDADLFHDAWHGLRAVLVSEMKRRGLWQCPPSYLGAYGWERWDTESPGGGPRAQGSVSSRTQDALGELVADCYAYIFVDRLPALKKQLQDKSDIDGLVRLNVRHFLHERQKEHDPLGFRIFELLQEAIEDAVSSGALHLLAGDKRIRNDSLLSFDPDAELPSAPIDVEPIVMRWNDELMPALITARSRQQAAVVRQLTGCLLELPRCGIQTFRFKDLVDPLKRDVRERWAVLLGKEEQGAATAPDSAQITAPAPAASTVETRQSFEHLTQSVSASIDRMETDPRTRTQLRTLWQYLWRRNEEEGEGTGLEKAGGHLPSYRQLGQRLSISRERLPVLFALLRQIVPR